MAIKCTTLTGSRTKLALIRCKVDKQLCQTLQVRSFLLHSQHNLTDWLACLEIDQLRPRSPPPRGGGPSNSGGGIGRGRGHRPPPASIPQRPRLPPAGGGLGAPPPRLQNPLPPHPHFHHQQHQPHHSPSPPQQQQQQQYPQFMPPPPMGVPPMGMGMPGMPGMPGMFGPGAGGMPPGMDMSFNPMMGMFNPMMMGAPPPGPPPQAMDWTAFFQNQANLNHQQNQQNRR